MTPLTHAAIMAADLPALRLWCAEYVMGWVWMDIPGGGRALRPVESFYYGAYQLNGETYFYDILPDYPADIAAAWVVHQKNCHNEKAGRIYLNELQEVVCNRVMKPEIYAVATIGWPDIMRFIEPQDICRAALLAVAEKDGQDDNAG